MLLSALGLASSLPRSEAGGGVAIRGLPIAEGCFASVMTCFVVGGMCVITESDGKVMARRAVGVVGGRVSGGNVVIWVAGAELYSKGRKDNDAAFFTLVAKQRSFKRPLLRCARYLWQALRSKALYRTLIVPNSSLVGILMAAVVGGRSGLRSGEDVDATD